MRRLLDSTVRGRARSSRPPPSGEPCARTARGRTRSSRSHRPWRRSVCGTRRTSGPGSAPPSQPVAREPRGEGDSGTVAGALDRTAEPSTAPAKNSTRTPMKRRLKTKQRRRRSTVEEGTKKSKMKRKKMWMWKWMTGQDLGLGHDSRCPSCGCSLHAGDKRRPRSSSPQRPPIRRLCRRCPHHTSGGVWRRRRRRHHHHRVPERRTREREGVVCVEDVHLPR